MCGIVGYVGSEDALPLLLDGLARLEYRGYDSAGVALVGPTGALQVARAVGRVRDLRAAVPARFTGTVGVGHTRWATHGPATRANAHPHRSADGRVAVVHNGIIDNASALRAELTAAGVALASDTDTEVVAHLVARAGLPTLEERVVAAVARLEGTYALAVVDAAHPDRVVVARNGSPLLVGVGGHGTHVASDVAALVRHHDRVVHLDDGEFATVTAAGFRSFTRDGTEVAKTPTEVAGSAQDYDKGGYDHYMRKEFLEQPEALRRLLAGAVDERFGTARLEGLDLGPRELRGFRRVKVLGCGSAYYVGQTGAQMIEEIARIPADAEAASEFRYRNPVIDPETLYVAVSQSGETVDTLYAVEEITRKGGHVLGMVNVVGSSVARACAGRVYLHAGPEVAVASTKALTSMGVAFGLLAVALGRVRDLSIAEGRRLLAGLAAMPDRVAEVLAAEAHVAEVARGLAPAPSLFFIGRVRGYPVAREGAQKFKEVSYCHAEAYPSSELKHGPLALITPQMPTVAVVPHDDLVERNLGALQEVAARKGPLVVVTQPGVDLETLPARRIDVPRGEPELDPVLLTVPMQLLAYHAALALGHDIDKPRNLAKAVTVE